MKALAIHAAEDIRLEDRPEVEPGPEQVRLRVKYVGICGSDLHYYFHGANGEYVCGSHWCPATSCRPWWTWIPAASSPRAPR